MLGPYRVVDISNERGILCGQILADLGADVICIEPPGGSPARRIAPFVEAPAKSESAAVESSLFWWAYARGKRSAVLDVEADDDREVLKRLVAGADFFIESEMPGRMAELGLGYEALSALNPSLVYVSITPFGQDGPKASWADSDITQIAAGGVAYLSGEAEQAPVRVSVPQAHAHAGSDAAVGALIAHFARKASGRGQHVDVSTQQSVTLATMFRALDGAVDQVPAMRSAGGTQVGAAFLRTRYRIRDGWVTLGPGVLASTGHFMKRLLEWALEEGFGDQALVDEDWHSFAARLVTGELGEDAYDATDAVLTAFFANRSKAELIGVAVERKLLLTPILGLDEVIDSQQMAQREFVVSVERPDGAGDARVPGPFAKFGASPIRYTLPPPRLDEHGSEIRREAPRTPAPCGPGHSPRAAAALPLEGVKILDLFWILAGPGATRMLADYGAEVVHVESTGHIDTLRVIQPFRFSQPHVEGSSAFQSANANKLGMTIDLSKPEGREIVLELAGWADVVTESFAPGVIDHYGLGWKTLRDVNPDLIMISSCLMGQTGPWRDLTGFGNLAASVTGFQQLASWPGRPTAGPFGAYTDFINVRYNALAILAALEHRDRTGEGQYIDESQCEAALHFLGPAFLDYTVNGRAPEPVGNDDPQMAPHGIFPAAGDEQWVAIAVRDNRQWTALCEAIGQRGLVGERENSAHVERAIAEWTRQRGVSEIESTLQALGIPAHHAIDTTSMFEDPQLQHRGHFVEIAHEIFPTTFVESSRLILSDAPARVPESAIHFGRDNRDVLERILRYPPERIAELAEQGVLS
jgi:crotonobetainyl-CoA:carnitine CoA-transferase CaiB-like acyl-CoA transferase